MTRIILLALILATASSPAQAGWKMYAPGQKEPAISSTETAREAERRANQDKHRQDYIDYVRAVTAIHAKTPRTPSDPVSPPSAAPRVDADEQARIQEHNERMNAMYRSQNPVNPNLFTCPPPRNKYNDGPRHGGHQRHEWREKTGFNTPAERTRYRREIQRLNSELKKERAKPNPAGDHPSKIRKQFAPKF